MFCPNCHHPNPADAKQCAKCSQSTDYFREHLYFSDTFAFVRADGAHPIAIKVDDAIQTYRALAILSRHRHVVAFGDEAPTGKKKDEIAPLPDQPKLSAPSLKLLTVITDRKIYKPGTEAGIFIVAPDAPEKEASLEIKLGGQKVYEAKAPLNRDGLALHRYADFKEGEYTAIVTLPNGDRAECTFSAAEFTLSPLIATLEKHEYVQQHLKFTLGLLVLSRPYSGPVEFGLQCQVCGERVVATQKVTAKDGKAKGDFDLSGHGGPFHVQVTTPDGYTALVSFPGTGAQEREHIRVNPLGQTVEAGLLPWEDTTPIRGLYLGAGEMNTTPLMLESAIGMRGKLKVASDLSLVQVVTLNPRTGEVRVIEQTDLKRGAEIEFDADAPYTLFHVGAFTKDKPFVGWGIVFKPLAFDAQLTAPKTAKPAEEIDIHLRLQHPERSPLSLPKGAKSKDAMEEGPGVGVFCLLLAYDARLEHESLAPKLAKRIYENVRGATSSLTVGDAMRASDYRSYPEAAFLTGAPPPVAPSAAPLPRGGDNLPVAMAAPAQAVRGGMLKKAAAAPLMAVAAAADAVAGAFAKTETETLTMVVAPTRMEFPELVHLELFYFEGEAARTVRLGDQIGTWRVRAYVMSGVDYQELTADVQADKPLYAELDVPAIASSGDDITAAVNYHTRSPADLVITTLFGETRVKVNGSGAQTFAIKGPGKVDVRIENESGVDWSVRDVARPGVQKVTASRLVILGNGQTARGEKVVAYPSVGHVLRDTIDALLRYPFG